MIEAEALTKTCPECAEQVKAVARVCRYCGYRWAPPPDSGVSIAEGSGGGGAEAEPTDLIADQGSEQGPPEGMGSAVEPDCFCGCGRQVEFTRRNPNDWGATVRAELDDWASRDLVGRSKARDFVQAGREISEQLKRSVHGETVDHAYRRQDIAYWVTTSRLALVEGRAADLYPPIDAAPEATHTPPARIAIGALRLLGRLAMWLCAVLVALGLIGLLLAGGNELFGLGLFEDGYPVEAVLITVAGGVVGAILFFVLDER